MKSLLTTLLLIPFFFLACGSQPGQSAPEALPETPATPVSLSQDELADLSVAYFASGCFWCVEAVFQSVEGVKEAVSGYSGGKMKNPTYQLVSSGQTQHAEAIEVFYDSTVVDFPTLVKVFFGSHDPTTLNRQGPDRGPQYRSIAFYQNEQEKQLITDYIAELESGEYGPGEIVTQVVPFETFYEAEGYHQEYERRNPNQPYVRSVSIPRLNRFKAKFPELLKKEE